MAIFLNPACGSCSCTQTTSGKFYIGGSFSDVNGTARNNLAKLNLDGTLDTAFNVTMNDIVSDIFWYEPTNTLYVAGDFTTVNGVVQRAAVGLDGDTGATVWAPNFSATLGNRIVIDAANDHIYVGGFFTGTVNGSARTRACRFVLSTGALDSWAPSVTNGAVYRIRRATVAGDDSVIMCGTFTTVNAATRNRLAAVSATTGTTNRAWNPNMSANTFDWLPVPGGSSIMATGNFTTVNGGATSRAGLCQLDITAATALDTGWNPVIAPFVILNGASGRFLHEYDALAFWVTGNFVNSGDGASQSGPSGIARYLYSGSKDTTFNPSPSTGTGSAILMHSDVSVNRLYVGRNPLNGPLRAMNPLTGATDGTFVTPTLGGGASITVMSEGSA